METVIHAEHIQSGIYFFALFLESSVVLSMDLAFCQLSGLRR